MKKFFRWFVPAAVFLAASSFLLFYMVLRASINQLGAETARVCCIVTAILYLICMAFLVLLVIDSMREKKKPWYIISWILLANALAGVFMFIYIIASMVYHLI